MKHPNNKTRKSSKNAKKHTRKNLWKEGPIHGIISSKQKTKSVLNFLTMLEDDDDVQHVYANLEVDSPKLEKALTA